MIICKRRVNAKQPLKVFFMMKISSDSHFNLQSGKKPHKVKITVRKDI